MSGRIYTTLPLILLTGASLYVGGRRVLSVLRGSGIGVGFCDSSSHLAVTSNPPMPASLGAAATAAKATGALASIAAINRTMITSLTPPTHLP